MRLLVLGGSRFVGWEAVVQALREGWSVTTFNTCRATLPGVKHVLGDRNSLQDLRQLDGEGWDVVVDTWAGRPSAVEDSASLLKDKVGLYCYVSTLMVYEPNGERWIDESTPTLRMTDLATKASYGVRKRICEEIITRLYPGRSLIVRPGVILGPNEYPGRLPWWLNRVTNSQHIIAPLQATGRVQFVDVRDLVRWMITQWNEAISGVFNVTCGTSHATMQSLVAAILAATDARCEVHWFSQADLSRHSVLPWFNMPLWVGSRTGIASIYDVDNSKVLNSGAVFRSLEDTVQDCWEWLQGQLGRQPAEYVTDKSWINPLEEENIIRDHTEGKHCLLC